MRLPFFQKSSPQGLEYAKVPGFGTVYLDHLIGEFETLKCRPENKDSVALAESIIKTRDEDPAAITWGQVYALEKSLVEMQTPEELRARAWSIESRYRDAVGDTRAYDAFLKSSVSDQKPESDAALRARIESLLCELYRLYTVSSCREDLRRRLSQQVSISVIVMAAIVTLLAIVLPKGLWTVNMVVMSGSLGGFVSFERRIQSLPSRGESLGDLVELSNGSGMYLSPISGAIFAVVLYMMFAGKLLEGSLFPHIASIEAADPVGIAFSVFSNGTGPATGVDWAGLIVWSFIAGFAERFVPDTLDRLISKQEDAKKS